MTCPSKVLFCGAEKFIRREGSEVPDIVLDKGCSRTMVRSSFVPEEKFLEGQAVTMQL